MLTAIHRMLEVPKVLGFAFLAVSYQLKAVKSVAFTESEGA